MAVARTFIITLYKITTNIVLNSESLNLIHTKQRFIVIVRYNTKKCLKIEL
jgi:hypothetical protein